ncbi:MAG: hypothetical protein HFI07_07535 [Lachnospiraceae bacterium]|nr:hypothetical protein [Lachnospiraceae bacterium]
MEGMKPFTIMQKDIEVMRVLLLSRANGNTESRIEVMCSDLLDKMNVEHVHCEAGEDKGKYVCMCPCMTTESKAILTGMGRTGVSITTWSPGRSWAVIRCLITIMLLILII